MTRRTIAGRRVDLRSVRRPAEITSLSVEGPGVKSLEGLQRMPQLLGLTLEEVHAPDLSLLGCVPQLESLRLDWCSGTIDYRPISKLTRLRVLYVRSDVPDEAAAIRRIELVALDRLEQLQLDAPVGATAELDPGFLLTAKKLRYLYLSGLRLGPEAVGPLCEAAAHLEDLHMMPLPPSASEQLRKCWPPKRPIFFIEFGSDPAPPADPITEYPPGSRPRFALRLDLAGEWHMETNPDAESVLIDELERVAPAVLARLTFDTESEVVGVLADERSDLEFVKAFIADHPRARPAADR
jgi:hypothetical protein